MIKFDSLLLISRLFHEHIKKYNKKLLIIIISMLIVSITTAANAWLMQPILDSIFLHKNIDMLVIIPLVVLINSIVKGIASFYQSYMMKTVGQRIISDIQVRLYSHLVYADVSLFFHYHSGNLISRFTNDINAIKKCVSDLMTSAICEIFTLLGLMIVIIYQDIKLASIALIIIPLAFFPIFYLGKRMRRVSHNVQEQITKFAIRLDETFQNIHIIKSYCREDYEIKRAKKDNKDVLDICKKSAKIDSLSSPIMETLGGLAIALVIWYGGNQVLHGDTTPGAFFSFITALLMMYKPLKGISQINTTIQEGLASSNRIFAIIDEKPAVLNQGNIEIFPKKSDIVFHNVEFAYKNNKAILQDLNMKIEYNKTTALVGSSGVGKSTIINLIQRFYDPSAGDINVGDQSIKKLQLQTLRKSIAYVGQDVTLFDDTIYENIRYGDLSASDDQIKAAAVAADAHQFIMKLPQEYDSHIGQKGVKLSGGQKQRIAIARAILKNAPVLILDEATSALDSISEKQVQNALESLKKGRTTLVIAHRLSTIKSADMIYFISHGKITEQGTHQKLLNLNKDYAKFYNKYRGKC